ncbi:MAG: tRNA preQ1(34) S-adenosylmethionine ribosyltransferase-isomerase QueA [Thermoplasmatales archaeon]|nr:tRNA preQ1(34) S-adenosylmethionine ribosyltransferase-isomerase QueA [Candidatus Thermoplasmatota archaeon]MCL6002544.1 tRNA preQ1(34) S-adenosylmethionine ribosyltransferase-isomerase QueA [Candidatus Thermoplasmatota archaeon]MDA8054826.1 tRNA preQ1(34) S-adenosylmethionine ribosyltransferase-isomerase QueA [Thermoplasmatales archaeon]
MNDYSLANYDFDLPRELIRQVPPENRTDCRLMILDKERILHSSFPKITDELRKGDILILNKTRVRKSLVVGRKMTGGKLEINFLRKENDGFIALIKGRIRDGESFDVGDREVKVGTNPEGFRIVQGKIDWDYIERIGHLPLPPYIKERKDYQYYQNEIGIETGSVAAPTASLHFSKDLLESLSKKGVKIRYVLLEVGYGTYKEIKDDCIREHIVDEEEIDVTGDIISDIESAEGKVVAVGTTVMRSLETASYPGRLRPYDGLTRIFIYPGWKFNSGTTHLLTNFHIPRSSLLSLVYAFGGEERIKASYREAIEKKYFFYSLGDAMLMDRLPSS